MAVDWSAAPNAQDIATSLEQGQAFGLQQGQKQASINALQGLDLNDPDSVNSTIQKSIRSGALDQANALQNLTFTRTMRQQIPAFQQELANALSGGPAASSAPPTPPSAAPAAPADPNAGPGGEQTTAPAPDPVDAAAHAKQTYDLAKSATDSLLATPLDQRPAAFEQVKQQMLARGIPEAAIDSAGNDLSDTGLKSLSDYYGGLSAHAAQSLAGQQPQGIDGSAAGAAPAAPPPPHPTSSWYMNLLNHPEMIAKMDAMKAVGYDMTPLVTQATTLAAPEIAQQATEAHAQGIAGATEAGKAPYDTVTIPINGVPHTMSKADYQVAQRLGTPGFGVDLSPQEHAQQTAAGTLAGNPEIVTLQGPDGQPVYARKDSLLDYAKAHGGVIGQGLSPVDQADRINQVNQANDLLKPQPADLAQAKDNQANAERALSIIASHKFDQTTPYKVQVANALRSAGFDDKAVSQYANDAAGYQAITTQALASGAHNSFPGRTTNTDLKLMHSVYPTLATPNDQAATAMGTQAAQANRVQDWEDFKANYQGPRNPQAIQRAWEAGPGGQSILQNREWAKIPIGGRPAFDPATDVKTVKGVKWGAWGIGTGHPVYFEIK